MKRFWITATFLCFGMAACQRDAGTTDVGGSADELGARDGGVALDGLCHIDDGDLPERAPEVDTALECSDAGGVDTAGALFTKDLGELPHEYTDLHAICARMDPTAETRDDVTDPKLASDIRTFLRSILDRPALARALAGLPKNEDARIDALIRAWFPRNAFEHVLCGELNPNGTVGGLHLWSELYLAEREDRANYRCRRGPADPVIAAIRFDWKPPGRADFARKPLGSLALGMSPACLLAVGYTASKSAAAQGTTKSTTFRAELYGASREWTLATDSGGMLSVYPLAESQ